MTMNCSIKHKFKWETSTSRLQCITDEEVLVLMLLKHNDEHLKKKHSPN